jgi:MoxR-like ATPase
MTAGSDHYTYTGNETRSPERAVTLSPLVRRDDPGGYSADEELAAAVNVALILGKPLLVTGEPGTGKTELARHVSMALGLPEPERFDTKSTSQAIELFYRFDSLARFHSANTGEGRKRAMDFITFGPLGRAILRSLPPEHGLFKEVGIPYPPEARRADVTGATPTPSPRRTVILIDEIDKAPRDFPNDLLDAIQHLRFSIPELEHDALEKLAQACGAAEINAEESLRPVVIITSNSEKNLPAPFLRRCVYFHIEPPDETRLRDIVTRRVAGVIGGTKIEEALASEDKAPLLHSSVRFFQSIRALDLAKPPATAELIDWVRYLIRSGAQATQKLQELRKQVQDSLGILVKSREDLTRVKAHARTEMLLPP